MTFIRRFREFFRAASVPAPSSLRLSSLPTASDGTPLQPRAIAAQEIPAAPSLPEALSPAALAADLEAPVARALPRRARIYAAFDANMPVANRHGLAGRSRELARLSQVVLDQHMHALICGARGSGKTSLLRVFGEIADEAGCVVLYDIASGDLSFRQLCIPFLTDLIREQGDRPGTRDIEALLAEDFSARRLATVLVESLDRPVIVLLDEFDRITSAETKQEFASLLKLLADLRAEISFVAAGIAADLEELIDGHRSLSRHLVAVRTCSIDNEDLTELLDTCSAKAGLDILADAKNALVRAAIGSPYHLRLFGLSAALSAVDFGSPAIDDEAVRAGLQKAFVDWYELNGASAAVTNRAWQAHPQLTVAICSIVIIAAKRGWFDRNEVAAAIDDLADHKDEAKARQLADAAIELLLPVIETVPEDRFRFQDTLAPQFLLLMIRRFVTFAPDSGQNIRTLITAPLTTEAPS